MKKRGSKRMICVFFMLAFFLLGKNSFSQTTIVGVVKDSIHPLYSVSVVLEDKLEKSIAAYTYSDDKGNYTLKTSKVGTFTLLFTSLGYQQKVVSITIKEGQKEMNVNVVLKEKSISLDQVIIKAELPTIIIKDTIRFKTKYFAKGTEQTVEDLLKAIPGLHIGTYGKIMVGNREIEKLMIDGDDFFEKGYRILSKNMPAYSIEEVEILKRYSNNRLLKGIEKSDKVAVNLKLSEKAKRIWFGTIKTGSNLKKQHELRGNLMNFGKKNKFFFLANLNTIGKDATGDIKDLISPFRFDEPASVGDDEKLSNLLDMSATSLNFKKSRTNFNNAKLASLNAIFNPTKKIKIKTLSFFNWDENDFFRNSVDHTTINGIRFTNTEDFQFTNKKRIGFGKLDFSYNISKTKMLESTTKYNDGTEKGLSDLVFNNVLARQELRSRNVLFDQKTTYTNRFKDKKVLLLTGRFIDEKAPQTYTNNQFLYPGLFPGFTEATNVQQQSKNQMQFIGFTAHLLDRKTTGNLLEVKLGNTFRKDKLSTSFTLFKDAEILKTPNEYQNNTEYQNNNVFLKSKYRHALKNGGITVKLGFHQLFNQLKFEDFSENKHPFYINPSIGFDWEINSKNKITSFYSYTTTNAKVLDVSNKYVLTGFRSFAKGTGRFNQLNASSLFLNYELRAWNSQFFADTYISYTKNFDFFSNNILINQNFTQAEKIVIKNQDFLNVNSSLSYQFKSVMIPTIKLEMGYLKFDYKNITNSTVLQEVTSNNYNYGVQLYSRFNTFTYYIGTKWTTNKIATSAVTNSYTNNEGFLDLSFVFSDNFYLEIQSEYYNFGNLNTTYYFLDFDAEYKLPKTKFTIGVTGKNLFNNERFKTFSISDIGTSTTEYRLLPRFVLLKMEYRF